MEWCPPGKGRGTEDLKIRGCRRYKRNEIEDNYRHGMDQQRGMKKENKTLGTGRCANIDTLFIYKQIYYYYYYILEWFPPVKKKRKNLTFLDAGSNSNERKMY